MARGFTIERLTQSFRLLDQAERDLRKQRNATLVMENLILGLKRLVGEER
jgi:hypothetical protein